MKLGWIGSGKSRIMNHVNRHYHPVDFFMGQAHPDEILKHFKRHEIDLICCTYNKILSGKLLEEYKGRIINFHPGTTRKGLGAIEKAVESDEYGGFTIHHLTEDVDEGPIIVQVKMLVNPTRTYGKRIYKYGCFAMGSVIKEFANGFGS